MTDETYTFEQTRVRLDGILVEVRKKDTSLEQSLELLEEGVRLLNQCNELIDQTAWRPLAAAPEEGEAEAVAPADERGAADGPATAAGPLAEGTEVPDAVGMDEDDDLGAVEAQDASDADADAPAEAAAAFEDDERD
jgi:exodeoxyribonuclease VII small subunit